MAPVSHVHAQMTRVNSYFPHLTLHPVTLRVHFFLELGIFCKNIAVVTELPINFPPSLKVCHLHDPNEFGPQPDFLMIHFNIILIYTQLGLSSLLLLVGSPSEVVHMFFLACMLNVHPPIFWFNHPSNIR